MRLNLDILSHDPNSALLLAEKFDLEGIDARIISSENEIKRDTFLFKFPILIKNTNRNHLVFNLHNSLLPKYRGFHAFCWAIQNGEEELGYTIHCVDKQVDAGAIFAQKKFQIASTHDINDAIFLGEKMLDSWLSPIVAQILRREILPNFQNSVKQIFPRKCDDNFLNPSATRLDALNLIRAVNPPYGPGVIYQSTNSHRIMLPFGGASQKELQRISKGEILIDLVDGQMLVSEI